MRSRRFIIKLILVLLMLAFIWAHSMMPGELSGRESEWFLSLMRPAVGLLQRGLMRLGYSFDQSFLVRKIAHFSEYAVLGVLMCLLLARKDGRARHILPAVLCLAAAAVDECIQIFVSGRGPAVRDVGIDFAGACLGILAAALVLRLFAPRSRRGRHE